MAKVTLARAEQFLKVPVSRNRADAAATRCPVGGSERESRLGWTRSQDSKQPNEQGAPFPSSTFSGTLTLELSLSLTPESPVGGVFKQLFTLPAREPAV